MGLREISEVGASGSGDFWEAWCRKVVPSYEQLGGERCDSVSREYRRRVKLGEEG